MSKEKSGVGFVCLLLALFANLFCGTSQSLAQGRLSRVRNSVRQNDPPAHSGSQADESDDEEHDHRHDRRSHHSDHYYSDHDAGWSLNLFSRDVHDFCPTQVVEHVHVYEPSPVAMPQPVYEGVVQGSGPDQSSFPPTGDAFLFDPGFENWFAGWNSRLTAIYGNDFDDLSHTSFGLLVQEPGQLGLDIGVSMFREAGSSFRDHLWLGDVNIVYEAIHSDRLRARMGVGVNWLADNFGSDAGANLTLGFDWQLNPHWVLTGETDFGSLGDTDLFHAQLSVGRQFERAEWTTGYNYQDIGGTAIGGVFTGMRFRF